MIPPHRILLRMDEASVVSALLRLQSPSGDLSPATRLVWAQQMYWVHARVLDCGGGVLDRFVGKKRCGRKMTLGMGLHFLPIPFLPTTRRFTEWQHQFRLFRRVPLTRLVKKFTGSPPYTRNRHFQPPASKPHKSGRRNHRKKRTPASVGTSTSNSGSHRLVESDSQTVRSPDP